MAIEPTAPDLSGRFPAVEPAPRRVQAKPLAPPRLVVTAELGAPPVSIEISQPAPPPELVPKAASLFDVHEQRADADSASAAPQSLVGRWQRWIMRRRLSTSIATSTIVHAVLIVVLGLLVADRRVEPPRQTLFARFSDVSSDQVEPLATSIDRQSDPTADPIIAAVDIVPSNARDALEPAKDSQSDQVSLTDVQAPLGGVNLAMRVGGGDVDGAVALSGRQGSLRGALLAADGGNRASEDAVARGLRWLEAHQQRNGSWNFNHQRGACNGLCTHPGSVSSTTAATALALLPFLGAGHTHREGDYQATVERGLYYLRGRMQATEHGADFQEGTMYAQGLAAIALCEALAMTGDASLRVPAEGAIDFIVYAQDKKGGGWRYSPGTPGDMTVTGWQMMALRSGQMNYLRVPGTTIERAVKFLDALGEDSGGTYGYLQRGSEPTSTAVGLLCRMLTGWPRSNVSLGRGVRYLSNLGPSQSDVYFDYYATQVLHHWGGVEWIAWNQKMRDFLVDTQSRQGHESGSWYFEDKHQAAASGGRLYTTCMAIMTLEVYYRYLPLYGDRSTPSDF